VPSNKLDHQLPARRRLDLGAERGVGSVHVRKVYDYVFEVDPLWFVCLGGVFCKTQRVREEAWVVFAADQFGGALAFRDRPEYSSVGRHKCGGILRQQRARPEAPRPIEEAGVDENWGAPPQYHLALKFRDKSGFGIRLRIGNKTAEKNSREVIKVPVLSHSPSPTRFHHQPRR
jgi:hypothetical protein